MIKQSDPQIDDSWALHAVKRCMFETGEYLGQTGTFRGTNLLIVEIFFK